ncbi:unnamed protein product [Lota lota]
MEEPASVVFCNVGQMYFPETRVDCHYRVSPQHRWSSKDWVGLFQVGWSSVKDYHTYTWAVVPEGLAAGAHVNCCAVFQTFYLPRPGTAQYQFVYVNEDGAVCARSRHFTFCSPVPLDELETMTEERDEEEGDRDEEEEEMLLVIPKAQLLKSQLDDSLKGQQGMRLELELSQRDKDTATKKHEAARSEWELERAAVQKEISALREDLGRSRDKLRKVEGRNKDVQETGDSLSSELTQLVSEKEEDERRIRELEEDVQVLSDCGRETDAALERMKERVKKVCDQLKYEEEKRKAVQAEHQAALGTVRVLQERLEASERVGEGLRRELGELGLQRGNTHGELHQTRLQAARLTLQLSEQDLAFKEAQASWAQERDAYRQATQVDQSKVQQLSRELQCREEWLREERREREELEMDLARQKDCNRVSQSPGVDIILGVNSRKWLTTKRTHEVTQESRKHFLVPHGVTWSAAATRTIQLDRLGFSPAGLLPSRSSRWKHFVFTVLHPNNASLPPAAEDGRRSPAAAGSPDGPCEENAPDAETQEQESDSEDGEDGALASPQHVAC